MFRAHSGWFLIPVVSMMALAACTPKAAQVDSAADNAALLAAAETFNKAYNDKNADAVAAAYTTDADSSTPMPPRSLAAPAFVSTMRTTSRMPMYSSPSAPESPALPATGAGAPAPGVLQPSR